MVDCDLATMKLTYIHDLKRIHNEKLNQCTEEIERIYENCVQLLQFPTENSQQILDDCFAMMTKPYARAIFQFQNDFYYADLKKLSARTQRYLAYHKQHVKMLSRKDASNIIYNDESSSVINERGKIWKEFQLATQTTCSKLETEFTKRGSCENAMGIGEWLNYFGNKLSGLRWKVCRFRFTI